MVAQVRRDEVTRGEVVELITTGTSEKNGGER
jgi:D-xylose transport system ATP-binding protein